MKANYHLIPKILFSILVLFFSIILIITITLMFYSPGKIEPFTDENGKALEGSISEKVFVNINGVRQGMIIRGKDIHNPVLLYIHGGPAFPNYFLIEKFKPGLEDHFIVCYWEQRGGGLSYSKDVTPESMNFGQLASDAIEVTNYLRDRFSKDKIYIMAHSGGTPFAIMAAARAPQLYHAYIGMAQITNQAESEKIAFQYMTGQYMAMGNKKKLAELQKYAVLDSDENIINFYKSPVRDNDMHDLGIGTMRNMRSVFTGVFLPVWFCKAYTLREKMNIWRSKFSFIKKTRLIDELFATDVPAIVPKLDIPVYFFSGRYDLTVNRDLSKGYFDKLQAPVKGFYTFDNSAHSPIFEEPGQVQKIIVNDILNGKIDMADR